MSVTKGNLEYRLESTVRSVNDMQKYLTGNDKINPAFLGAYWDQIRYEFEEARKLTTELLKEIV